MLAIARYYVILFAIVSNTEEHMIKLNSSTFRNAFRKAKEVRPAVFPINESEFEVLASNGSPMRVVFLLHAGALWAECSCPAGSPAHGSRRAPLPCYHVAAALLGDDSPATVGH